MKKLLTVLLAFLMALSCAAFFGCAEKEPSSSGDGADSGEEQPETPETPDEPDDGEEMAKKISVYLIAGQSNALGCTATERLDESLTGTRENVLFYANGEGAQESYDNHAAHNRWTHVAPGFGVNGASFGLEIGMSDVLSDFYPAAEDGSEQVAIIKYTWGGTGLAKRWLTASGYPTYSNTFEEGGRYVGYHGNTVGDLYANFLQTVETATAQLVADGYEPVYKGLAWMQGCDDASGEKNGKNYEAMLRCFVTDVRKDLGVVDLPIAIGQINLEICPYGDTVREAQYKVAHDTKGCAWVYTRDLNMKADDWWHFDSPDMYEMGRRFASELVLQAEDVPLAEIRADDFAVSAGAALYTQSATEITLPAYAEAMTEQGAKLYVPLTYSAAPATAPAIAQTVTAEYNGREVQVRLVPQDDPVADGRLDEDVWETVRAVPIGPNGSVVRIYAGEAGVYLGAEIVDTSIMNQWYDGAAWDPYLEDDGVKFYLHTGERTAGAPDSNSYAVYLTASNVLRVYRGRDDGSWDAINHYGRYEEGYYRSYRHRVRLDGTPFNTTLDVDSGYSLEIFIPYECLGGTAEEVKANLKVNCAYDDKRDYEIPHAVYQLNGGVNEYDDLSLYLPYSYFMQS